MIRSCCVKQDELDCVCAEIRRAASKTIKKPTTQHQEDEGCLHTWSLADFDIGPVIAKGCSAVVHAARLTMEGFKKMGDTTSEDVVDSKPLSEEEKSSFPLAIKMMFNYEAESNANAIINAMHRYFVESTSTPI